MIVWLREPLSVMGGYTFLRLECLSTSENVPEEAKLLASKF